MFPSDPLVTDDENDKHSVGNHDGDNGTGDDRSHDRRPNPHTPFSLSLCLCLYLFPYPLVTAEDYEDNNARNDNGTNNDLRDRPRLLLFFLLHASVVAVVAHGVRLQVRPRQACQLAHRREAVPVRVRHRHDHELQIHEKFCHVGVAGVESERNALGNVRQDRRRDALARVLQSVQYQPLLPSRLEQRERPRPDLQRRNRSAIVLLVDRALP